MKCFFVLRSRLFSLWKSLDVLQKAQPPLQVPSLLFICPRLTWETSNSDAVTRSNPCLGQSTAPLWSYPTFSPLTVTAIDPGVFSSSMVQDALIFSLCFFFPVPQGVTSLRSCPLDWYVGMLTAVFAFLNSCSSQSLEFSKV